jgi:hypothetical protein
VNWLLFGLVSWVLFGLELGLRDALRIGPTAVAPSFVMPLAVLVASSAPRAQAWWACLMLGLITDLTNVVELKDQGEAIGVVGPYALGYVLGGHFVMTLRGMIYRRTPFAIAFLTLLASVVCQSVVVAAYTLRGFYDPIVWDATGQLMQRMGSALYTGGGAIVVSLALLPLSGMLGLSAGAPRRFSAR